MTVGEIIQELKKYPEHFEVEVLQELEMRDDKVAPIESVSNSKIEKIVSLCFGRLHKDF